MHLWASKKVLLHSCVLRLFCVRWDTWYNETWVFKSNCHKKGTGDLILATQILSRPFLPFTCDPLLSSFYFLLRCWIPAPFLTSPAGGYICARRDLSQGAAAGELLEGEGLCLGQLALSKQDTKKRHTVLTWALKMKSSVAAESCILWVWQVWLVLCYTSVKGYRVLHQPPPTFEMHRRV